MGVNSKFKVIVFTPIWGRHDIVRIWQKGIERIKNYWPEAIEIIPFCMVSNKADKDMIESFGYQYTYCDNTPLGAKHNAGAMALKDIDFDYILQLGSDDLITNEYLEYALAAMVEGKQLFGVNKLLFCEPKKQSACSFHLTTQSYTLIGAGRFISREAIEKLNYKLWLDGINRGLDMTSQSNLANIGISPEVLEIYKYCVLDVKSDTNIWSYEHFADNHPKANYNLVKHLFPEI